MMNYENQCDWIGYLSLQKFKIDPIQSAMTPTNEQTHYIIHSH